MPHNVSCAECGATFTATAPNTKYCSKLCRGRAKNARIKADPVMFATRRKSRLSAGRAYLERNRESIYRKNRERYWADPEAARADALARYYKNPQATIDRNRRWRENNRERDREYRRNYYAEHPEQMARYALNHHALRLGVDGHALSQALLDARAAYWGWSCWMCGGEFESWDHVKPVSKGGSHMAANLRPACLDCNQRKSARWFGATALSTFRPAA